MPNFIKIGQTLAEIWRFNCFSKWRLSAILDFGNSNFLTVWTVKRPILRIRAKFRRSANPLLWYRDFCGFQDGSRRHLGFWKIRHFNGLSPVGGQSPSPCQISSKSVKRLQRYGNLTVFKMAAVRHLGFGKFKFLTVCTVKSPILHNRAKFRKDLPICCCDIAIFVIFQDGCRRHLVFWKIGNFNDLPPVWGQSAPACQISSKSIKRLLRYGDLMGFFQNGGRPPSWICRARIATTREDYSVVCIVVLNLVGIAAVLSIILKF